VPHCRSSINRGSLKLMDILSDQRFFASPTDKESTSPSSISPRIRLFYPCLAQTANPVNTNYCTDGRVTSDGMASLVGFRQVGLSFLLGHLAHANSGCHEKAAPNTNESFPLLVYCHGYGGNMDMATYFFRCIAAQGMHVAALEHTDGTASSTIIQNGKEADTRQRLDFDPNLYSLNDGLRLRATEMRQAVDYLSTFDGASKR